MIGDIMQTMYFEDYEIQYKSHEYRMEFKIFKIVGYGENKQTGKFDVPLYGEEFLEIRDNEDTFWEGSITWDGCSNWNFKTDDCMAHFCGRKSATSIGRLMEKLYDIAATMPKFDSEIAA